LSDVDVVHKQTQLVVYDHLCVVQVSQSYRHVQTVAFLWATVYISCVRAFWIEILQGQPRGSAKILGPFRSPYKRE